MRKVQDVQSDKKLTNNIILRIVSKDMLVVDLKLEIGLLQVYLKVPHYLTIN